MSKKDVTVEEAMAAPVETEAAAPPAVPNLVTREELNAAVSDAVSKALAGVIPELVNIVNSQSTVNTVNPAMGPSAVVFKTDPVAEQKASYLKHYRLDDVASGKYQEFDMEAIRNGARLAEAVMKGSWIHFQGGHFYAETQNQVDYLDWKIETDPLCKIYVDEGGAVIPCIVDGCAHNFATESALMAHLKATHGVGK